MAKTITFTYKKTAYTLEFTRETVSMLEQNGLSLADVQNLQDMDKPINTIMMLFTGAFLAHHRKAASITTLIDEIWETIPDKKGLISSLIEMYVEPVESLLMSEPEDEKGKTVWTVNQ